MCHDDYAPLGAIVLSPRRASTSAHHNYVDCYLLLRIIIYMCHIYQCARQGACDGRARADGGCAEGRGGCVVFHFCHFYRVLSVSCFARIYEFFVKKHAFLRIVCG